MSCHEALRKLSQASHDVEELAIAIHHDMADIQMRIGEGQHCRSIPHQRMFDLAAALQKRKDMIELCQALESDGGAITEASKGRFG